MLKSAWQLPIIFVALTIAAPARAADIWVAANVHGSVFELLNDQWRELKNGDGIASGIAVRTLQAGRVRLVRQGAAGRIAVRFTAGLAADWNSLPDSLRHGLIRLAAFAWRQRDDESSDALPPAVVAALWRPWRRYRL